MAAGAEPRFAAGERVRIVDLGKPGHVRTPAYVRGRVGTIERFCGLFENPEGRAYGREGRERIALYRVHFAQRDLWSGYAGDAHDTLEIEIYEHWLAPEKTP
jgi:nitrile hydratase beta subunit-like protein